MDNLMEEFPSNTTIELNNTNITSAWHNSNELCNDNFMIGLFTGMLISSSAFTVALCILKYPFKDLTIINDENV